ncbi:MAG: hypothetical protein ABR608_12195 [Pseudonocardiaceae bacterium]
MLIEKGLALFDESFIRDRQLYSIHLANALSRPGKHRDLDDAAQRGIAAIDLSESLDSTRGINLLHDLYRQMKRVQRFRGVKIRLGESLRFGSGSGVFGVFLG